MVIVIYTLGRMLRCSVASILRVWSTSHNNARLSLLEEFFTVLGQRASSTFTHVGRQTCKD